ncbi:hypothetical protein OUZ56_008495 [Daphnia magna]|uniref:t-SNARE coiled-coil homology domain-containing protein n=1 Tax=Daphnia magna TaxID=35525 RepID=A0ABR0AD57_9CRUS|nr:hypothetical protein OUZ56_008495 [Daphnia magna]
MPKDRLAELHEKNGGHQCDEEDTLLEVRAHPSKFYQRTKVLEVSLCKIQEQINQQKILQENILASPTSQSSKENMDRLSKSITTNMTQTGKDLKDLRLTATKDFHNRKITDTEFRMVNNLQSSLTIRFQALWDELCCIRNAYESKCKRRIQRQLEIAGYEMGDDEVETALTTGLSVFSKEFGECEAAKLALRDLEDRRQELLGLEKNIQEMHDLFVELNLLVECQGEVVNSIEKNVGQAAGNVDGGKHCLQEARQKQTSLRKKKIVCAVVVVGALVLAVVITISILFG